MDKQSKIRVVSVADNRYLQHLAVAYVSLLANLSPGSGVAFYVIDDGLTDAARERLERSVRPFGAELRFIPFDRRVPDSLRTSRHITETVYSKVYIPEMLRDQPMDKAIYLDCDVVVNGDIRRLWEADLGDRALLAVRDPGGGRRCRQLGIPDKERYFNAGVLVFNLAKWRERRLTAKVMAYIERYPGKLQFHDQDGLNAVLHDDWLPLDATWNCQTNMLAGRRRERRRPLPSIVHYTGSSKPWQYDNNHPYRDCYFEYLRRTEWRRYRPARNVGAVTKRMAKALLPYSAVYWLGKMKEHVMPFLVASLLAHYS